MALYPEAVKKLLPENQAQPRMTPTQVILHSAVDAPGPTSLFPYFARVDVNLESHFFIKVDGTVEQYMDTEVRADANYHANLRPDGTGAISIETEDEGNPEQLPWTAAQLDSIERLIEWIWRMHHNVAVRVCESEADPGIGFHTMWGAPSEWTPVEGKTCPGHIRVVQFNEVISPWIESHQEDDLAYTKAELTKIVRDAVQAEFSTVGDETRTALIELFAREISSEAGRLNKALDAWYDKKVAQL